MDGRRAAGVDLGGTKIYSLVATEDGQVLGEDRRPTQAEDGPDAVIERVAGSLQAALEAARLAAGDVEGIGISSPGPCDPRRGVVTFAPNLLGWGEVPLARLVSDALRVPTLLEHDAAAACYGEFRFGAARGFRHIIYVTLGTGIGGGIMIDGKLYGGASGAAGETGHLILDADGPRCGCGSQGCVEAFASGWAIARDAEEAIGAGRSRALEERSAGGAPTAQLVGEAARQGDAVAREIIERAGRRLGQGLAGLLNCFDPEVLILGGGLTGLGDLYLGPAIDTARALAFDQMVKDATITIAELGERAGALGAAALVINGGAR